MGLKTLKWVDSVPPRVGGTGVMSKFARTVKRLHDNPNRWAEVGSSRSLTEVRTLAGRLRSAGLQVSQRKIANGWTKVYARYNATPAKNSSKNKKNSKKK